MMRWRRCMVLGVMVLGVQGAGIAQAPFDFAQGRPPATFDTVIALAEAKMKEFRIPGVAIGIVDNGTITTQVPARLQGA